MLRLLLLMLLLLLRLLFALHSRVLLLWLRLALRSRVLLLLLRLALHSRVLLLRLLLLLLLRFLFALHSRVLLLWLRFLFVLHSRLLLYSGGRLRRTWFASFGAGWSSGVALESFLPLASLAMMMLLKKLLTITLALPVSTPIRILPLKTLPVLRLSLIPCQPSRSIPGLGPDNIAGSISVIWGPTVFRAVKIV